MTTSTIRLDIPEVDDLPILGAALAHHVVSVECHHGLFGPVLGDFGEVEIDIPRGVRRIPVVPWPHWHDAYLHRYGFRFTVKSMNRGRVVVEWKCLQRA